MKDRNLHQISDKEWYYGNLTGTDNVLNGAGLKRERDGSFYYGTWENGLREGNGALAGPDGELIVGNWKEDKLAEVKLHIYPAGNRFSMFYGKMEKGEPREGALLCSDGKFYYGIFSEWRKEDFNGEGALLWPDKRIYAGRWKNGGTDIGGVIRRADGRMTGILGNVRDGYEAKSWQKDADRHFFYGMSSDEEARNAKGILFYADDEFFAGEMRGGQRSGSGIYRSIEGKIYIGEWQNGILQGYGMCICFLPDAVDFYIGDFRGGLYEGEGCLLYRDSDNWTFGYVGSWKEGKKSGKGFNWRMGTPEIPLEDVREPGPSRKYYSSADTVESVVLNSLERFEEYGNEKCFMGIRADNNSEYQRTLRVEPGCDYEVRIFYHNDAEGQFSDAGGTAYETKLRVFYTKMLEPGEDGMVSASISSANAFPSVVWDCVKIQASEEFPLSYKIASAKVRNSRKSNGRVLSQALFTENGFYLGTDELDGILPPGEYGYVTFILHTGGKKSDKSQSFSLKPAQTVPVYDTVQNNGNCGAVRIINRSAGDRKRKRSRISVQIMGVCEDGGYAKAVKADIGEEISVKIAFTNSASDQDIRISAELPAVVEYIAGTSILSLSDGSCRKQSDNWIREGLSLPNFMADGEGELDLKIRYFPNSDLPDGEEINVKIETEDITIQNRMSISGR